MFRSLFILTCSCFLTICFVPDSFSAESSVPDFEKWTLSGPGERISSDVLQVSGDGKNTAYWRSPQVPIQDDKYYRYSVSLKGDTESGCLPCGLESMSRDYRPEKDEWSEHTFCFRPQNDAAQRTFRLGQWESTGTYQFKNVALTPIVPILSEADLLLDGKKAILTLGDDEMIKNGSYRFSAWFGGENANIHRPLFFSNASFNSNRWCFEESSQVVYHFELQPQINGKSSSPIPFDNTTIQISVCHYSGSQPGIVEVSRDGETRWSELGKLDKTGLHHFTIPPIAFPLKSVYLRIRGVSESNFQVDTLVFEALLQEQYQSADLKNVNAIGKTLFATCMNTDSTEKPVELSLTSDGRIRAAEMEKKNKNNTLVRDRSIPLAFSPAPGKREQKFSVGNRNYSVMIETHPLHRSDYGYTILSDKTNKADLWWCEADWKVSQTRPAPVVSSAKVVRISAAKNDIESFQVVVRADNETPIHELRAVAEELKGPNGTVIPKDNVEILFAYYHFVHSKTDDTGLIDYWPDALPPLDRPIDIEPGKNQPLWINVKVPENAAPGDYQGVLHLTSKDGHFRQNIPYTVHVWDFALPKENHHETAYGFNPHLAAQYHNAKTDEDRRRVNEMYLQCFSDHRISIYNPTPYNSFSVKWLPDNDNPENSKCEIDFSRYDAEMSRVLEKFHFTNFTVPGHGLGGGTFHARSEPSLAGFAADTPQYKAMMSSYYTQLVNHLKEKGWLDKSYVYWFDEPGKHDYEFVAAGTARLEHFAPELARFMTLMMKDRGFLDEMEKIGTSINIWCPVTYSFDDELAKERMKKGERFWWYVCTGPKAPYCTLFIDHPATELRVWHWQGWQRGIVGSLIWQSNYWHSGTAFPNSFQNPYEDPMGYVSGYSVPSGTKQNWGNGDGRFIYPPLNAAVPGMNDGKPVFDKPVSSIRWAMIREGVEDYEMLYLLRERLKSNGSSLSEANRKTAEELLSVPESITKNMTDFTIDPRPLLLRREKIGETVEKLSNPR